MLIESLSALKQSCLRSSGNRRLNSTDSPNENHRNPPRIASSPDGNFSTSSLAVHLPTHHRFITRLITDSHSTLIRHSPDSHPTNHKERTSRWFRRAARPLPTLNSNVQSLVTSLISRQLRTFSAACGYSVLSPVQNSQHCETSSPDPRHPLKRLSVSPQFKVQHLLSSSSENWFCTRNASLCRFQAKATTVTTKQWIQSMPWTVWWTMATAAFRRPVRSAANRSRTAHRSRSSSRTRSSSSSPVARAPHRSRWSNAVHRGRTMKREFSSRSGVRTWCSGSWPTRSARDTSGWRSPRRSASSVSKGQQVRVLFIFLSFGAFESNVSVFYRWSRLIHRRTMIVVRCYYQEVLN